jgi:acyl-CoA thioesterase I
MRMKAGALWLLSVCLILITACSDNQHTVLQPLPEEAVILAFGDSLTYGTGAEPRTESYPAILSELSGRIVINAGVPGEISREGLKRLPSLLETHQPQLVLLCHGGNDLIRKLSEEELRQNLTGMVTMVRQYGAQVVMVAVPKPGLFLKAAPIYQEVAQTLQVPLENDIIADIESQPALKSDPIHPNAEGYYQLGERVYLYLQKLGAF